MVRRLSNGMRACDADDECRTPSDGPVPTDFGKVQMCHRHANEHAAWVLDTTSTRRERMVAWALVRRYGLVPDPLRAVVVK